MYDLTEVPGYAEVVAWFGRWPSFHDAEVTRVHLNRAGSSFIDVHAFRMTSETIPSGHYVCDKHAVITFELIDPLTVYLEDFNQQNVLSGLQLVPRDDGFELTLHPCFGLTGLVKAKAIKLHLVSGVPEDSIYLSPESPGV